MKEEQKIFWSRSGSHKEKTERRRRGREKDREIERFWPNRKCLNVRKWYVLWNGEPHRYVRKRIVEKQWLKREKCLVIGEAETDVKEMTVMILAWGNSFLIQESCGVEGWRGRKKTQNIFKRNNTIGLLTRQRWYSFLGWIKSVYHFFAAPPINRWSLFPQQSLFESGVAFMIKSDHQNTSEGHWALASKSFAVSASTLLESCCLVRKSQASLLEEKRQHEQGKAGLTILAEVLPHE